MTTVASRELRNNTRALLDRVAAGEDVVITVRGRAVAQLTVVNASVPTWISRTDLVRRLSTAQADTGLRLDLARLAGDTTDDLDPLR